MLRTVTLGGVAVAVMSSGCCWRPFCGGPGPSLYNPPPAPLFPRLHPSYWAPPPAAAPAPAALPASPVGLPGGPDCPGCVGGALPPGALPHGAGPYGAMPYGAATLPPGAIPGAAGPVTVSPPPGLLSNGPQFSPAYFGPTAAPASSGSTQLPPPRAGDPPSAMPMR